MQHRQKRFRLLVSTLSFRDLSVLSVTFMHCAQTAGAIDTISSAYDRIMSFPDLLKI